MKTAIAIVDDHPLTRRGIRAALEEEPAFAIIAEGGSAEEAAAIAQQHQPDVMFLDINMPGGGARAAADVKMLLPHCRVIMLTVYDNLANVRASLEAGASAYVLKGVEGDEIIAVVKQVLSGKKFISPDLAARLVMEVPVGGTAGLSSTSPNDRYQLTDREDEILSLIRTGKSYREIAAALELSEATIKQYASNLFRKIGVKNRLQAAIKDL
jgi:DNA-binding NarL/FixJ family response regulator